ncbi:hypothetical protein OGZ39_10440 [Lactococcus lactis]|uniref:Uncharacterized protein n=1 Tax=Lactococcus lactis TaxID=1358 RepID=A0A9X4NE37_9LACT|nr:hypothetical protein [Lactococcus lactis]MDG4982064.1 hypothetical protein [Lactococcus lactis]THA54542.1 hypothetical protein E5555_05360 [Lactococcus lactis]
MRRRKAEIISVYGGDGTKFDSYVSHYGYVNIPRFKHKKKPISMIKALDVRDSINYRKKLWAIQERSNNHFPELTPILTEVGGGTIGKVSVTNLETGEKRWI